MVSICITLEPPWLSTFLSEAICRFRARCRSFSVSSLMKRRVLHILSVLDGAMASFARTAGWLMSHGTFLRALGYFAAVIAAVTQASPRAPSWHVRIRRFRSGSGRRTWLLARHPACRPFSFSGNSGCLATRQLSRSFISCESAWCVPTKIGSEANLVNTSKPTKPWWAGAREGRGEEFTT